MIDDHLRLGPMPEASIDAEALGRHLQQLRETRGWSLSRLANDAGIAKSNLCRLEQGNGNPTLDTLWRLAAQLEVPFGTLIKPVTAVLDDQGVQIQLIDQGHDRPSVDVYWMHLDAQVERWSLGHPKGVRETITVISGSLRTGAEELTRTLAPGDSHSFAADGPHLYATEDQASSAIVTIVYPTRTVPT